MIDLRSRWWQAVIALTLAAAAFRFSTLGVQSFWLDEAATVVRIRLSFGGMLRSVLREENTPPLYFALAWVWGRLFGTSEVALRSLSAIFGTATVPLSCVAVRELVSRRAGLIAGAVVAVSPLLVWYSQEARAYALLALLTAASFLFFVRALREPRTRWLALWAATSGLALLTHYFAVFPVAVETVWLLVASRSRRAALVAAAAGLPLGAAALPLAVHQAQHQSPWEGTLRSDVPWVAKTFLIGETGAAPFARPAYVAGALVLVGLVLAALRTDEQERSGVVVALGVGACAAAIPLLLAQVGVDYLNTRNLIEVWLPLAAVYCAGYAARRAGVLGLGAAAALVGVLAAISIDIAVDENAQRDDWRALVRTLGSPASQRLVIVEPSRERRPLDLYLPARPAPERPLAREVDVVVMQGWTALPFWPHGFRRAAPVRVQHFVLVRFRSDRPREVAIPPALQPGAVVG